MDLSQMPRQVLVGAVSKRLFVLHRWEGTLQPGVWRSWRPKTVCGCVLWQEAITVSKILDADRVRPCKRCFRDYQPPQVLPTTSSSGVATVHVDRVEYPGQRTVDRVAVFGVRYHVMEPSDGWDDVFVPVCGARLVGGSGRLMFESEAIDAGVSRCPDCRGGP